LRRKPAVAGYFYPQQKKELRKMIEGMVQLDQKKEKAFCLISPHAGYIYSGPVAGAVFSAVYLPDKFVILGPSHRGIESRFAIMKKGIWETPLGEVSVDTKLAELIINQSELITEDNKAHLGEHSLEVQLPFIQFFREKFSLVPICIGYYASFEELEELGKAIASGIKASGEETMIVTSTDMSHYVPQEVAKRKDFLAINKILALEAKGLYEVVNKENISMCGFQPTTAALVAAKLLGAKKGELVKYQTSGDMTGDYREVVGYAGIKIV